MIHKLLYVTLATTLATAIAMSGCSRKSETHDPDTAPGTETEVVEEMTVTEPEQGTDADTATPDTTTAPPATGDTAESPNSEGQLICTPEWFKWVNEQVMSQQSEAIAEQFPSGLPDVGSDEWFLAIDKLTGGDGAHGPDGGSDEWCFMIQQRLSTTD
ncbi:hypothetical protein ACONUD_02680 [Microbulbifer harenosus]|uniref:Secreted protein n=1 Tax=Microbulbifer harenosus TaxID=2576840 RepID=A0ABY2UCW8_9GAMM|nr:hypothetical protein [Microbulbifer harenosus]TLM73950.1 hypothetical protein FDY93_18635 [Microbulbifer harenosus]